DRRADPMRRPAKSPADRLRLGPPWGGGEPSRCSSGVRPDAGHGASILMGMSWGDARGGIPFGLHKYPHFPFQTQTSTKNPPPSEKGRLSAPDTRNPLGQRVGQPRVQPLAPGGRRAQVFGIERQESAVDEPAEPRPVERRLEAPAGFGGDANAADA